MSDMARNLLEIEQAEMREWSRKRIVALETELDEYGEWLKRESQRCDMAERKLKQAQACIRDSWRGIKRAEWKETHAEAISEAQKGEEYASTPNH